MKVLKIFVPIIFPLLPVLLFAQANSSHIGKAGIADVADEDPGLFIVMMLILCAFSAAFLAIGIFSALALSVLTAFIVGGVISMSVFVGFYQRSVTKGLKFFMALAGTLVGAALGMATAFITIHIFKFSITNIYPYFTIAGILGGGLIGLTSFAGLKMSYNYLETKLLVVQAKI